VKASSQLGHQLVTVMLRSEPPLDDALNGANIAAHSVRLLSIPTSVLDSLQADPVAAMQEVVDRVLFLYQRVVLPPEDVDWTRTKLLQFFDQTTGLVPADAIEERLGELEPQEPVRAPDARKQARPTRHGLFERDLGIDIEVERPVPITPLAPEQRAKTNAPTIPGAVLISEIPIDTNTKHAAFPLNNGLSLPVELLRPSQVVRGELDIVAALLPRPDLLDPLHVGFLRLVGTPDKGGDDAFVREARKIQFLTERIASKLPEGTGRKRVPDGVHSRVAEEVDRVEGWQSGSGSGRGDGGSRHGCSGRRSGRRRSRRRIHVRPAEQRGFGWRADNP